MGVVDHAPRFGWDKIKLLIVVLLVVVFCKVGAVEVKLALR